MRHVGDKLFFRVSQRLLIHLGLLRERRNWFVQTSRSLFCETGKWDTPFLTQEARLRIEEVWKPKMKEIDERKPKGGGEKYYVLSMFPYPSGKLHMGHVRVYTISDALARYYRMRGRDVIHPMGWDSFGLPAENAAKQQSIDPRRWTNENIEIMKEQLGWMCFNFDWDREVSTCDPRYYKWTQWLFCQLLKRGLAYRKEAMVNWDPVDQTVLAAEQVDAEGRSWRSGAIVEKKPLLQWYIKTTAYAKELYESLGEINDWKGVPEIQKWWIGKPKGSLVDLDLVKKDGSVDGRISVHVMRPESLFGAAFVVISPSHIEAVKRLDSDFTSWAEIPLTGKRVPVVISHDFPFKARSQGGRTVLDAVLGCPALYEQDKAFAEERGFLYQEKLFSGSGEKATFINCHPSIDGLRRPDGVETMLRLLGETGRCVSEVSPFLGDWLISRQRYWGTPIPVIHCTDCGPVPVPEDQLPVVLPPELDVSKGQNLSSPLLGAPDDWRFVPCPRCGKDGAARETDTMDTFVDSSWYFFRYLDSRNEITLCDKENARKNLPVDVYIGGKEHALLHLFYARFMYRFLRDLGFVDPRHKEPFRKLIPQGMIMGQSFKIQSTGQYISPKDAILEDDQKMIYRHRDTDDLLETKYEKMSKSKFNGVDPQECVQMWGCDTTRLCMLSIVPPDHDRPWSLTSGIFMGTINWQRRLWVMVTFYLKARSSLPARDAPIEEETDPDLEESVRASRNSMIRGFEYYMESSHNFNSAIKKMHILTNDLRKLEEREMGVCLAFERAMADMTIMLFPFAPMFAAEMWRGLASAPWHYRESNRSFEWTKDVWEQKWPKLDDDVVCPLTVRLNGTHLATLKMAHNELERVDASSVESLLDEHILRHDCFTSIYGGDVRAFDEVTFEAPFRYVASVNIIMNSVPTVDSESENGREKSKPKFSKTKVNVIEI